MKVSIMSCVIVSSRACCEPELEFVGGNCDPELGFAGGVRFFGMRLASGGDLDLRQPG